MKKRLWVVKVCLHTSIWLRKRESDLLNWNVWCSKSQRLNHNVEISKISSTNLKRKCIIQKGSNVMNYAEAKWKASKFSNHSCGRSYMLISIIEINYLISYLLCMTWLNWSLKFHSSLRTIPHLIHTHNTQV